jgi:hypothetical protein
MTFGDGKQGVLRRGEGQKVNGRPLVLSPELGTKIIANVRRCGKLSIAAQAAGVHRSTLSRWMVLGLSGEEPYGQLFHAVEEARGEWAMERVQKIVDAEEWQASAWLLERMPGEAFDRPKLVVDLQALPQMTDDQLEELVVRVFGKAPIDSAIDATPQLPADVANDDGGDNG